MKKFLFLLFSPCLLLAELVLYYSPQCPHSRRVLDYLHHNPREVTLKNVYEGNNKEGLKMEGGKMQVPCLVIDGKPLYHDEEIIRWLSTHP